MLTRCPRSVVAAFLAVSAIALSAPRGVFAVPDPTRVGFPSSDPVDGKFLSMPGKGMSSLAVPTHLSIGVPASQALQPLVVEVFDGDVSGKWDKPGGATTTYELYADKNRDGTSMSLLASKTDVDFAANDDAWGTLYVGAQSVAAQAPSGHFFYRVIVTISGDAGVVNAYKVAVNPPAQIGAVQNEFGVIGGVVQTGRAAGSPPYDQVMTTTDPLPSLNPSSPNPLNTYDGKFAFLVYVGTSNQSISFQEGDADHATDVTAAKASEAALAPKPGVAADGADGNVLGGINVDYRPFRVGGPVGYRIKNPGGLVLSTVLDPSGDAEYETVPTFDTSAVGYYRMEWFDVDMRNTFFIKPDFGVQIFSAESAPVGPPLTSGLGGVRGVLFHDRNGNGAQESRESGLEATPVDVTNLDTLVTTTVLTNAYGEFAAAVPAGQYRAAPSSGSDPAGVLDTTVAGPTPVLTVTNGAVGTAVPSGFTDPTGSDPDLRLVPECRGVLTHVGLDIEIPADLTNRTILVEYTKPYSGSIYDSLTFFFNGRFSQPVLGFNRNLRVVNVYVSAGATHVVVDTTASSRGFVRRMLRPGNVSVSATNGSSDTGLMRPYCRPTYLRHGQVLGGVSTVKSLR
jgi:hypothetical protein